MAPPKHDRNDILFAHKALNIVAGFSAADRRVAGAILDHFNRTTGQCDPSVGRLAALLGIGTATVKRATEELCRDDVGLFRKVTHGGKYHRSSFEPRWDQFRKIVLDWDRKMALRHPKDDSEKGSKMIPSDGSMGSELIPQRDQFRSLDGIRNDPLTNRRNQSKEPIAPSGASGDVSSEGQMANDTPNTQSQHKGRNGLLKGNAEHLHRSDHMPSKVVVNLSRSDIADDHAAVRLEKDMQALGTDLYVRILDAMTAELLAEATAAERAKRGQGVWLIQSRLAKELCHG